MSGIKFIESMQFLLDIIMVSNIYEDLENRTAIGGFNQNQLIYFWK